MMNSCLLDFFKVIKNLYVYSLERKCIYKYLVRVNFQHPRFLFSILQFSLWSIYVTIEYMYSQALLYISLYSRCVTRYCVLSLILWGSYNLLVTVTFTNCQSLILWFCFDIASLNRIGVMIRENNKTTYYCTHIESLTMHNKHNGIWWVVKKLYLHGFIIVTKIANWIRADLIKLPAPMLIYGLKKNSSTFPKNIYI